MKERSTRHAGSVHDAPDHPVLRPVSSRRCASCLCLRRTLPRRATQLADDLLHLRGGPDPYVTPAFFDFRGKVMAVVEYFAADGLTLPTYLKAARRGPYLFTLPLATIQSNVKDIVHRLASDGLNPRDFLQRGYQTAPTIAARSGDHPSEPRRCRRTFPQRGPESAGLPAGRSTSPRSLRCDRPRSSPTSRPFSAHFQPQGLTLPNYLRAAQRQPSLFYQSSATIIGHVEEVMQHLCPHGLTLSAYLKAAVRQPPLFTQASSTLLANLEGVVTRFREARDDLARLSPRGHASALTVQPSADTVASNTIAVTEHFREGRLTLTAYLRPLSVRLRSSPHRRLRSSVTSSK